LKDLIKMSKEAPIPHATIQYKRVKTPIFIQMEAVECGAACLGIILAYFGKYVRLEELRIACGVSRDGSSALNILKAGKNYGLDVHGYHKEIEELFDVPLPFIAHWGFNHFVVIEGFSKKAVFINDPNYGRRKITYLDLDINFTGVILTLSPTSSFTKSEAPPFIYQDVLKRIGSMKWGVFFLSLIGLLLIIIPLSMAAFSQVFLDYLLQGKLLGWKWYFIFGMTTICLTTLILNTLKQKILNGFYLKMSLQLSTEFFLHIISLPLSFFAQRFGGEISYRMGLNDNIAQTMVKTIADGFLNIILACVFGFILFYYDVVIATVALSIVCFNLILIWFLYRSRLEAYACLQQAIGKSSAFSIGGLSVIETLKATSSETKYFSRWMGYYTKLMNTIQLISQRDGISGVAPIVLGNIANLTVLMVGIWRIMNGQLTIGMLVAMQILAQNFINPVFNLLGLMFSLQLFKVDSARINDVLDYPKDPIFQKEQEKSISNTQQLSVSKLSGYIEVTDLAFGFNPNAPPVFKDINLSISPGKSVALVGPSGCGKSTIAKLIAGLYAPLTGEIRFDGALRTELPRELITNSLCMVEQDTSLFTESIKDNITLLEAHPMQSDLIAAAKDACIHEDILNRKGGYDLILEQNGSNISGGQRQRIQIARALYRNPSILVLDEATSALDSDTEAEVMKNIRRRGCSCLIVAHRLSSIKNCDEIIVILNGTISQRGTHLQLLQQPGLYKTLVEVERLTEPLVGKI
jgi:ATP-binding cassette, subfamily C, bacterial